MSDNVLNEERLATLPEMHYLLLEVLDREEPLTWYELSFSCKEWSLNFAYSFENTIKFLKLLSVIEVHGDRLVNRVKNENYEVLKDEPLLGIFIIRKTLSYLKQNSNIKFFQNKAIISDLPNGQVLIDVSIMPIDYIFLRKLFINLGIARPDKQVNTQLYINEPYKNYFKTDFFHQMFTMGTGDQAIRKPNFFISYASQDETYKAELQNHFSGLINEGTIRSWDGCAILPGQDWDAEVKKKLEEANFVLLLVSADFMASKYINDVELKKAMERHNENKLRIIPIIVRPCDFRNLPIARYQALPRGLVPIIEWSSRDAAYTDIVKQIRTMLSREQNL